MSRCVTNEFFYIPMNIFFQTRFLFSIIWCADSYSQISHSHSFLTLCLTSEYHTSWMRLIPPAMETSHENKRSTFLVSPIILVQATFIIALQRFFFTSTSSPSPVPSIFFFPPHPLLRPTEKIHLRNPQHNRQRDARAWHLPMHSCHLCKDTVCFASSPYVQHGVGTWVWTGIAGDVCTSLCVQGITGWIEAHRYVWRGDGDGKQNVEGARKKKSRHPRFNRQICTLIVRSVWLFPKPNSSVGSILNTINTKFPWESLCITNNYFESWSTKV